MTTSNIAGTKKSSVYSFSSLSFENSNSNGDDISPRSFRNQISSIFPTTISSSTSNHQQRPTLAQQRSTSTKTTTIRGSSATKSESNEQSHHHQRRNNQTDINHDRRFEIGDDGDDESNDDSFQDDENFNRTSSASGNSEQLREHQEERKNKDHTRRQQKRRRRKRNHSSGLCCSSCCCCRCCQHLHICQIFYLLINDRSNLKIALLRLLPSIFVMKAFWLSVASVYVCDLASVQITSLSDEMQQPQHKGIINVRSFGLFSYSKNPTSSMKSSTNGASLVRPINNSGSNNNNYYYYNQQQHEEEDNNLEFINGNQNLTDNFSSFWNETSEVLEEFGENIEDFVEEELGTCHSLKQNPHFFFPLDKTFHIARVCGISTIIVGVLCVIVIWIHTCKSVSKKTWRLAQLCILLCCTFEGMTLIIFHTNICNGQPYITAFELAGQNQLDMKASADEEQEQQLSASSSSSLLLECQCELAGGSEAVIVATLFWFLTYISMKCVPSNLEYTWAMEYSAAQLSSNANDDDDELHFYHEEYEMSSASTYQKNYSINNITMKRHHLYEVEEGNEEDDEYDDDDLSTGSDNSFNYDNDKDDSSNSERYSKIT